jgi:hypothetical protein
MKVAPYAKSKLSTDFIVELVDEIPNPIAVVYIGAIGMRGRHYVRDAVSDCEATHFESHLPGFRTVIEPRKNMGVDINHW